MDKAEIVFEKMAQEKTKKFSKQPYFNPREQMKMKKGPNNKWSATSLRHFNTSKGKRHYTGKGVGNTYQEAYHKSRANAQYKFKRYPADSTTTQQSQKFINEVKPPGRIKN